MSVGKVQKTGAQEFQLVDFDRKGLGYGELAEFIGLGHEIEVSDESGNDITKATLAEIAVDSIGLPGQQQASEALSKLMDVDLFRLHQLIEDDEVREFLSE